MCVCARARVRSNYSAVMCVIHTFTSVLHGILKSKLKMRRLIAAWIDGDWDRPVPEGCCTASKVRGWILPGFSQCSPDMPAKVPISE